MSRLDNAQTFLSAYKHYKQDTEYIAGWLAETARSLGYDLTVTQDRPKKPRAKNKGGKAKKNNRNAGKSIEKKYLIRIADFVPLAEKIAVNETGLLVPVALSKVFNRAIQTRKSVGQWFLTASLQEEESNQKHHHFVNVLEDTFLLLRPLISTGPRTFKNAVDDHADFITLSNRFEDLTVEDIADIADEADVHQQALPAVASVVLEQDEGEVEEELRFAIGILLLEIQTMRDAACQQWESYQEDKVDLIVAAMTTDMAIRLVQKAEVEFDLVVRRPQKYPTETHPVWTLLDILGEPAGGIAGPNDSSEKEPSDSFWHTYRGLKYYFDRILKWDPKKSLPAMVPKDFGDRKLHDYTRRALECAQVGRIGMFGKHPEVWDLVSKGIEHMFQSRQVSIWVVFAVDTLFHSQDILDGRPGGPYLELAAHVTKLTRQNNKIINSWHSPFLPLDSAYDVFIGLGTALQNSQDWVTWDGFDKQWDELTKNRQLTSHPVLKKLRKEKNYVLRHNHLLCGMLKYELYMKRHAAGMKLEHQTLAIVMMAHLYTTGHLEESEKGGTEHMPSWPDMEFALYAQDPAWVFLGGRPKSVQESKNKFSLAIGSSIANSARDIPIHRLRININKLREFRETLTFGEGVFLPSDKFSEEKHDVSIAKIEDITKRLVDTTTSEHTWNRLAKQLLQSQSTAEDERNPAIRSRLRNPFDFLQTYAEWLQADMAGLFFDWLQMGILCADIWSKIRKRVEPLPGWDITTFNDEKPAMEPAHDILLRDHNYPLFLEAAYNELLICLGDTKANGYPEVIMGDVCLVELRKHHHATAAMLRAPGPLSLENLYADWPKEEWKPRWAAMAKSPKDELFNMFMDSFLHKLAS